jgi:hypothetical protein
LFFNNGSISFQFSFPSGESSSLSSKYLPKLTVRMRKKSRIPIFQTRYLMPVEFMTPAAENFAAKPSTPYKTCKRRPQAQNLLWRVWREHSAHFTLLTWMAQYG